MVKMSQHNTYKRVPAGAKYFFDGIKTGPRSQQDSVAAPDVISQS
jgi:hypothetical protein